MSPSAMLVWNWETDLLPYSTFTVAAPGVASERPAEMPPITATSVTVSAILCFMIPLPLHDDPTHPVGRALPGHRADPESEHAQPLSAPVMTEETLRLDRGRGVTPPPILYCH